MEDGGDSSSIPRSDSNSKVVGEQSNCDEFQQKDGLSRKRVKMRHLDSVFRSDDMNGRLKTNEEDDDDMSPITDVKVASDFESETTLPLDLNAEFCFPTNSDTNSANSRGIALDLNLEDVSSSINQNHSRPYKNTTVLKPRDVSHCQTQTPTALEKDPLRVWKEMKQNGFLSSSHGGISVQNSVLSSSHGGIPVPKKRGRKSKNDHVLNKKMELAKREQVDRFTKIAAPTGLLNGLNPGIINHVRNRKQVHSIIQALVKSEKPEHFHSQSKHPSHLNTNDCTPRQLGYSDQCRHTNTFSSTLAKRTTGCTIPMLKPCSSNSEEKCGDGDSTMIAQISEDGTLAFKLSSSAKASDNTNTSSLSNEESANLITASSLSVKAASVASQWLELLQQDIKGRLSALRRSKKRVRDVIATELPFLISKEFSDQENDPYITQNNSATADQHRARWSALFDQMDKALSEEEKQLESWSYQVKEMQLHCDHGLNHIHGNMIYSLQQLGASIMESKLGKVDGSDKELAVRAAAASIYSTCNFLLTKENVSCF